MEVQTQSLSEKPPALKWWHQLNDPTRSAEVIIWALLILCTVLVRAYLVHLIPVAIWSDDAGSYVASAFKWVHTGVWSTDPRRGPIYSLLISACAKPTGNIDSVMIVQHCLGGISILLSMAALRCLYGRRLLVPMALCSYAYAVYVLPVYLEHLIRNETVLFTCSSLAFVFWLLAIKLERPHLLWISGIAAGILMCTKSVFGPFPAVVFLGSLYYWRATPRQAAKFALIFAVAFVLPSAGVKVLKGVTHYKALPQPQAGILFYARTAQFTVLDGGIEPEIKEQIRKEVEDYRALPKLDNNLIIYHTIVPHLRSILFPQGKTPAYVNNLCMRMALEGISHNKLAYAKQVLHDLERLHLKGGYRLDSPKPKDLSSVAEKLQEHETPDALMRVDQTIAQLKANDTPNHFKIFHRIGKSSWLFSFVPVLLTSLLLPLILWRTRDRIQLFWFGAAAVWYFTMVLLSTVGRPLDRYLIPSVPVMFFALSTGVIYAWQWLGAFLEKRYAFAPETASGK